MSAPRPPADPLEAALADLARHGASAAEVYVKQGRSRRLSRGPATGSVSTHEEKGWAVRATTPRASLLATGSGELPTGGPWPEPDGLPLRLPGAGAAGRAGPWSEPAELDLPLVGESEGMRLLDSIADELAGELPGGRLLAAVLEDGASTSRLASSRGVAAAWRSRVALLHAEAAVGGTVAAVDLGEREARRFAPGAVARRLADRLAVAAAGPPPGFTGRDRGDLVLAPPLVARLLAALRPFLVGPAAQALATALRDRRGRLGSEAVTLIDDGRLPGGLLEAPVDGEGLPTREVVLVEEGAFRQPLLAWHEARGAEGRPSGCSRRASWRDPPAPGPTHLYLAPRRTAAADLVADLARGFYLLEATGPPRVDPAAATFTVPVCGFAVQAGRATAPLSGVHLAGGVGALLQGIVAVARDLAWFPLDGMIGAPTARVQGLELRAVP